MSSGIVIFSLTKLRNHLIATNSNRENTVNSKSKPYLPVTRIRSFKRNWRVFL